MAHELWENRTLDLIDSFDDEAAALAAVRAVILRDGPLAVQSWALDRVDAEVPPLQGRALIDRALASTAA
jgi:hypothetical protein